MIMINLTLLLNWCLVLSLSALVQILGAEDGPEGCLGQQLGAVVGVLHVGHTHRGVADPVVDHRVHRDRHAVLSENLLGHHIEHLHEAVISILIITIQSTRREKFSQTPLIDLGPEVDGAEFVDAGQDEVETRGASLAMLYPAQPEDDGPLVLLDDLEADTEGEGEGDDHQQPGGEHQQPATQPETWGSLAVISSLVYSYSYTSPDEDLVGDEPAEN